MPATQEAVTGDLKFKSCLDYRMSSKSVRTTMMGRARYPQIVTLMFGEQPTDV